MERDRRRSTARLACLVCLTVLAAASAASPAAASIGLGQLAGGTPPSGLCNSGSYDMLQPSVTSGNTYVAAEAGTITSWTTSASANPSQAYSMKIFRKVSEPAGYTVVAKDGPRALTAGVINTFQTSVQVKAGDVLGLNDNDGSTANNACTFAASDSHLELFGNIATGDSATFGTSANRINIGAQLAPSNAFSVGGAQLNKNKGTATIKVSVPNPGRLTATGKGAKTSGAHSAATNVTAPGTTKLTVRATGKKKAKLNSTGKVKLGITITFTPTDGEARSQQTKVKLKKKPQ